MTILGNDALKPHAIFLAVACSVFSAATVYAADTTSPSFDQPHNNGWAIQVTPYVWAAGLKGHMSPFKDAPTLSVRKSFSDVMSDVSLGGFINVWGRKNRFVFSGDAMYISTRNGQGSGPLSAFQIPGLGVTVPPGSMTKAKVKSKQFMATVQGGYRVLSDERFTLDVLGGMRFWHISTDVAVTASHASIGQVSGRHKESFDWVDPIVGVRAFVPLANDFSLQVQADVGGFGIGSQHTWSALATLNYVFLDGFSASAGYKVVDVNYDRRGHVYDVRMKGPVVGLTYRF